MKRPKQEDVGRRVPDQKLAADDMAAVPGKEPVKHHKPDMAAASSSHSSRVSDCFRFYIMAFKLARDAIVSRIPIVKNRKETCAICFEDTGVSEMFSVNWCLHRYCFSCMKKHVEAKLNDGAAVTRGLRFQDSDGQLQEVIARGKFGFYYEAAYERSFRSPGGESLLPTTQMFCSNVERAGPEVLKRFIYRSRRKRSRKCIKCGHFFCIDCRVPWHYQMSCADYGASKPGRESGDAKLKSLASQKSWRQCINCNNMVELTYGCYHIRCRCGYKFCYNCGAKWVNRKRTCKCPVWREHNLIRRDAGRQRR